MISQDGMLVVILENALSTRCEEVGGMEGGISAI